MDDTIIFNDYVKLSVRPVRSFKANWTWTVFMCAIP